MILLEKPGFKEMVHLEQIDLIFLEKLEYIQRGLLQDVYFVHQEYILRDLLQAELA